MCLPMERIVTDIKVCPIIRGVILLRKYNINLDNFDSFNNYKKY
jgi:hypothetical protein